MGLRQEFARQLDPRRFAAKPKPVAKAAKVGDVESIRVRGNAWRAKKTYLEAEQVIAKHLAEGWELTSDTRVGRMGGILTFRKVR